jgi:predicted nucleic acid-binding protein
MNDKFFIDSNVVVYAYDVHNPIKQAKAASLLREGLGSGRAVISAQVLGEFFVTVTRKIRQPLSDEQALRVMRVITAVPVVHIDHPLVYRAVAHHQQHRIAYWDGLIIAAAERAGCGRVMTEDLSHGQRYGAVIAENPFL